MQLEFQRIVEEFTPDLYWLAYSYCMNRSDAEDVVQEVLLKYLQHRPQCAGRRQLRAWLMTATANKCKDLLNSGWRQKTLPLEDVHAHLDHLDEVLEVQDALSRLPPELRGVVHLYYFEGLPAKQIAEALHLSEAAVHSRLHRARKQLEKLLGGD